MQGGLLNDLAYFFEVGGYVMPPLIASTFLEAAGVGVPDEMTGRSLLPVLQEPVSGISEGSREYAVTAIERHTYTRPGGALYPVRAIRTREFLYLRNYHPDRWPTGGDFLGTNKFTHGDIDTGPTKLFMMEPENMEKYAREYQLSFGKRPAEELYRIADDPDQVNNLADNPDYAGVKKELAALMNGHLAATGDPRMNGEEPWQDYIYHQYGAFGLNFNESLPEDERRRARLRPGTPE